MIKRPWLPVIIWTLFILVLCGMPGKAVPHFSWWEAVSFDKWVHAFIFFLEVVLLIAALERTGKLSWGVKLISFLTIVLYGGLLELGQKYLFVDRSFDYYDFLANTIGAVFGVIFARSKPVRLLNNFIFR